MGYTKSPKLILKFNFEGEKKLKVTLILLNKYYLENNINESFFGKNDGFLIYKSNSLLMFKSKTLGLPKSFPKTNIQSTIVYFNSDKERYEFLKVLRNSLLEWSNSKIWKDYNKDINNISIKFGTNTWILF